MGVMAYGVMADGRMGSDFSGEAEIQDSLGRSPRNAIKQALALKARDNNVIS
jgi:hypothetical protein